MKGEREGGGRKGGRERREEGRGGRKGREEGKGGRKRREGGGREGNREEVGMQLLIVYRKDDLRLQVFRT